jgi:hypothetical protein
MDRRSANSMKHCGWQPRSCSGGGTPAESLLRPKKIPITPKPGVLMTFGLVALQPLFTRFFCTADANPILSVQIGLSFTAICPGFTSLVDGQRGALDRVII